MAILKCCPFCGEIPYIERIPLWQTHGSITHGYYGCFEYEIKCRNCGCNIRLSGNDTIYHTEEEAKENVIKVWNTRANEKEVKEQ